MWEQCALQRRSSEPVSRQSQNGKGRPSLSWRPRKYVYTMFIMIADECAVPIGQCRALNHFTTFIAQRTAHKGGYVKIRSTTIPFRISAMRCKANRKSQHRNIINTLRQRTTLLSASARLSLRHGFYASVFVHHHHHHHQYQQWQPADGVCCLCMEKLPSYVLRWHVESTITHYQSFIPSVQRRWTVQRKKEREIEQCWDKQWPRWRGSVEMMMMHNTRKMHDAKTMHGVQQIRGQRNTRKRLINMIFHEIIHSAQL